MKSINFQEIPHKGITKKYICKNNKSHDILGSVSYYLGGYVFKPLEGTLYSAECLEDIRKFVDSVNKERRGK